MLKCNEKKPHPICRRSVDKWLLHTLKTIPLWYSPTLPLAIGQCENAESRDLMIDWLSVCCLLQRLFRPQTVSSFETIKQRSLKICTSSAFQTISVKSVYIKIINYNGIIHVLANLNKTVQKKQHAAKKKSHSYSVINKIF